MTREKSKTRHWWWQVLKANEIISLVGEDVSMKGLFDLSNGKGGTFSQVQLITEQEKYTSFSRMSGGLREQSYNQLYFITRDGWKFPVSDETVIERSPGTDEKSTWKNTKKA
jgi:hypothetical protein